MAHITQAILMLALVQWKPKDEGTLFNLVFFVTVILMMIGV